MADLGFLGIKARNLKCFGDSAQGIDRVAPINIIIGRNNTGKTSLLDIIEFARTATIEKELYHDYKEPEALVAVLVTDKICTNLQMHRPNEGGYLHKLISAFKLKTAVWRLRPGGKPELDHESSTSPIDRESDTALIHDDLLRRFYEPFSQMAVIRLAADRDIVPEVDESFASAITDHDLKPSGGGATRILARMLTRPNHQHSRLITNVVLRDLNHIYQDDGTFESIRALREINKQNGKETWEIYLECGHQTMVALSKMGSGVKTVLLILLAIHVMPKVAYQKILGQCIFCFEELENNLHPAIQKRLFRYLRDIVRKDQCVMFITTHSHVVIDLFSKDPDAQLIHVTHDEADRRLSRVEPITTRGHHTKLFDDLGVKASDLLQSNCVIWVEGPSDRMYVNRWIELFDSELREHDDYEFAFTGGTLLSHYAYDDPDDDARIQALRINRHAVVLMDKDTTKSPGVLKDRVARVIQELEVHDGVPWVTEGKEVENYIPVEALRALLGRPELEAPDPNADMFEVILANGGRDFSRTKVLLAQDICGRLDRASLDQCLNLGTKVRELCLRIRQWNSRDST